MTSVKPFGILDDARGVGWPNRRHRNQNAPAGVPVPHNPEATPGMRDRRERLRSTAIAETLANLGCPGMTGEGEGQESPGSRGIAEIAEIGKPAEAEPSTSGLTPFAPPGPGS